MIELQEAIRIAKLWREGKMIALYDEDEVRDALLAEVERLRGLSPGELPPLPEPAWRESRPTNPPKVAAEWFSADMMRSYAQAAVLAERQRCAELAETEGVAYADTFGVRDDWPSPEHVGDRIAAAIRAQEEWPAHLRDDAPHLTCSSCGRKSWDIGERGRLCNMTQPTGNRCNGTMWRSQEG